MSSQKPEPPYCNHPARCPKSLMPLGTCDEYQAITSRWCVSTKCCQSCEHYVPTENETAGRLRKLPTAGWSVKG